MPRTDKESYLLPCGQTLQLNRLRSEGILTHAELSFCNANDIPVAYDPLQSGWLPAQVIDDLYTNEVVDIAHPRVQNTKAAVSLHLRLRPWEQTDVPRFRHLLDDPLMWEHMPEDYPNPLSRNMAEALIDLANASNHHQVHAILHDNLPIGQVRLLFESDPEDLGVAELSYWIGRDYWGQGFASAAVRAFSRQSLAENSGLSTLIARVKRKNVASRRVLEKAGFVIECDDAFSDWLVMRKPRP